jgi:hypothetical protein
MHAILPRRFANELLPLTRRILRRRELYLAFVTGQAILAAYRTGIFEIVLMASLEVFFVLIVVPFGAFLVFLQAIIWLRILSRRFGKRRAGALAFIALVLVTGARFAMERFHNRAITRTVLIDDPTLYSSGFSSPPRRPVSFIVSPDQRWLIYVRDPNTGQPLPPAPEVIVRELVTGEERPVMTTEAGASSGVGIPSESMVEDVITDFFDVLWTVDGAVLHRKPLLIDPSSATIRSFDTRELWGRETATYPAVYALAQWRANVRSSGRLDPSVAWDGEHVGEYIYNAEERKLGNWRSAGTIRRLDVKGKIRRVVTKTETFADWSLETAAVSPDGRLIAYTGRRDHYLTFVANLVIPYFSLFDFHQDYVFVHDTRTKREYEVSAWDEATSFHWSADGRHLYYADTGFDPKIVRVDLNIPSTAGECLQRMPRLRTHYTVKRGGKREAFSLSPEYLAVRFRDGVSADDARWVIQRNGMTVKSGPDPLFNLYFVKTRDPFEGVARLAREAEPVDYVGPVLGSGGDLFAPGNHLIVCGDDPKNLLDAWLVERGAVRTEFDESRSVGRESRECREYHFTWSSMLDLFALADSACAFPGVRYAYPRFQGVAESYVPYKRAPVGPAVQRAPTAEERLQARNRSW